MASTKEYRDFILEQLSEAPNITCRPMMGLEVKEILMKKMAITKIRLGYFTESPIR